jgi:hypothetical protein
MTTGVQYQVILYKNPSTGGPEVESINFRKRFTYDTSYVSNNVVVQRDLPSIASDPTSVRGPGIDRYIVTTSYIAGSEPNLNATVVNGFVQTAVAAINAAYPSEFTNTTVSGSPLGTTPEEQ